MDDQIFNVKLHDVLMAAREKKILFYQTEKNLSRNKPNETNVKDREDN